ncbi:MAG: DNA repair protein RecN [Kiritimatiellae bacterium]|nr:DNA repair protein RecN [Kiritimatiellia bacterium]
MIEELSVRGLAVVEKADISFGPGLNAVTGETGAGKSVLLSAIGLLTGQRGDRAEVRAGETQADVRARIVLPPATLADVAPILEEAGLDPCEDGALLLRRTLSANGSGRCFANGGPATVQTLRRIGARLVDFHGPHDNQSLLDPAFQLEALDSFGACAAERAAYAERWAALRALRADAEALRGGDEGAVAREIDLLRYQVREIEEAALDPEADGDALRGDYAAATNAARILELGSGACAALSEADGNAVDAVAAAVRALEEMRDLSSKDAPAWLEELTDLSARLSDLSRDVSSTLSRLDASPERLAGLEARMSLVETLRHKYGRTVPDVLAFLGRAKERLAGLEGRGERLAALEKEIREADAAVRAAGRALSGKRRKAAGALAKAVVKELADLGLAKAGFDVRVEPGEPKESGLDDVGFGFAPNPGEPMRPLRQIASSGEISRVMLALKTVLAAHDRIPVLVFDEIDANVGGEIARVVGRKLAALGASRQVLCITHLPQVASCAATHFVVSKEIRGGRTFTSIGPVEGEARVDELARMLGGEKLTSVVRRHAAELLSKKD